MGQSAQVGEPRVVGIFETSRRVVDRAGHKDYLPQFAGIIIGSVSLVGVLVVAIVSLRRNESMGLTDRASRAQWITHAVVCSYLLAGLAVAMSTILLMSGDGRLVGGPLLLLSIFVSLLPLGVQADLLAARTPEFESRERNAKSEAQRWLNDQLFAPVERPYVKLGTGVAISMLPALALCSIIAGYLAAEPEIGWWSALSSVSSWLFMTMLTALLTAFVMGAYWNFWIYRQSKVSEKYRMWSPGWYARGLAFSLLLWCVLMALMAEAAVSDGVTSPWVRFAFHGMIWAAPVLAVCICRLVVARRYRKWPARAHSPYRFLFLPAVGSMAVLARSAGAQGVDQGAKDAPEHPDACYLAAG